MKTHSMLGADMLRGMQVHQNEPLVKAAYEICRWHHERYDGRGYPDGLKGDEIPISAQIVALADVYDALTSERVYKKAYTHEVAVQMILDGQCGQFNPLLMECLRNNEKNIKEIMGTSSMRKWSDERSLRNVKEAMLRQHEKYSASERTLQLLEHERMKYRFFADMSQEVQFEYTTTPPMVTLSEWGARHLGLDETIMNPLENARVQRMIDSSSMEEVREELHHTTPDNPVIRHDCRVHLNCEDRWMKLIARATWSDNEPPQYTGAIGKVIDVHESKVRMDELQMMASHDTLTGLYNHKFARARIEEMMADRPDSRFALGIFDLDYFKQANDTYGHLFGDEVLKHMSQTLKRIMREGTITARVGGDEFLLFFEYHEHVDLAIRRIYNSLIGQYGDFNISVSMGVAKTDLVGTDYDTLFHAADQALYAAKRGGRGQFRFYDGDSTDTLSLISPIDGDTGKADR